MLQTQGIDRLVGMRTHGWFLLPLFRVFPPATLLFPRGSKNERAAHRGSLAGLDISWEANRR